MPLVRYCTYGCRRTKASCRWSGTVHTAVRERRHHAAGQVQYIRLLENGGIMPLVRYCTYDCRRTEASCRWSGTVHTTAGELLVRYCTYGYRRTEASCCWSGTVHMATGEWRHHAAGQILYIQLQLREWRHHVAGQVLYIRLQENVGIMPLVRYCTYFFRKSEASCR